ncbi:MAG: DNA-deoxyinosine glycosylase [Methylococcales bacterium]
MNSITGFLPIADKSAKILILGSMPSTASLTKQQYYAHPRNAFWPIMLALYNHSPELPYQQRKQLLIAKHIAVWDVLQSCCREGSLDSAIKVESIKINDFQLFFSQHPKLKTVCFNGSKAETVYKKQALPKILKDFTYLKYHKLPSTSPAYAAMSLQQKTIIWSNCLKDALGSLME